MANKIISVVKTTDTTLPVECALAIDASGNPIAAGSQVFTDCVLNAGSSDTYTCTSAAPAGTYPVGAHLLRLKGSSPAVTAVSKQAATVTDGGGTSPAAPTDLAVSSQRVASFTPASGKTAANYAYSLNSGATYAELPAPSLSGGKVLFTVPGSVDGTLLVRLKAIGTTPAGIAASAAVPAFGTSSGSPVWLMAMGDSQSTQAFGKPWPNQIEEQIDLTQFEYFDNRSIGGFRIADIASLIPAYLAAWDKSKYPQAIAVFYLGINNCIDEMPLATMLSQYDQVITQLKAAGVRCMYVTFSAFRGFYDPNATGDTQDKRQLALRNALNQEMIANGVSQHGFDKVVDITQDANIGTDLAPYNNAGIYFNAQDKLHLLTQGQAILVSYIYPALLDLAGALTPPAVVADTLPFKYLGGMKQAYNIATRDSANPVPSGQPWVVLSQGFGATATTDPDKNYYEFTLRKKHTSGLFAFNVRPYFSNDDYYGLFGGYGVYFSPYDDLFMPWENGDYRAGFPGIPFADGDRMRLCNTPAEVIVKLNGIEAFRVTKESANAGCTYMAVWRAPLKVGPITFHAEYPAALPY